VSVKLKYLLYCFFNFFQKKECPYCNSYEFKLVDRKYFFSRLLYCLNCDLQHRHPKDSKLKNKKFYNKEYKIDTYLITDLPDDRRLQSLISDNFSNYRDISKYINSLNNFENKLQILDYGCSWGYNVKKLSAQGFKAIGYELSSVRAKFGEDKLAVTIHNNIDDIPSNLGAIITSHVIEHLHDINELITLSKQKLSQNGFLLTFCPNGDEKFRKRDQKTWHENWGNIHPNHLTINFFRKIFKNNPYLILTGDWEYNIDTISNWDQKSQIVSPIEDRVEIFVISKPNVII
jgi:hypothetical protein